MTDRELINFDRTKELEARIEALARDAVHWQAKYQDEHARCLRLEEIIHNRVARMRPVLPEPDARTLMDLDTAYEEHA